MIPSLQLNDGRSIPQLGIGTWPFNDDEATEAVQSAFELGYRHVDTAAKYGNERGVGEGIRRSAVDRADVFVTTKLDGGYQGDDRAVAGLQDSLGRLGLEYVDLLLIHWPLPARGEFVSTWKTFEKLQAEGLARSIGVSNFKPAHLDTLAAEADVVPAVNQIQLNPGVSRIAQREYDTAHGIVTESWSPFGGDGAALLASPVIVSLAERLGRTPGQIVLRWHLELGLVAIPKTSNPARMAENLGALEFELSAEDLLEIAALDGGPDAGVDSDVTGH